MYYFSKPNQDFTKYFNKNTQNQKYLSKYLTGAQKPSPYELEEEKTKSSPLEKASKYQKLYNTIFNYQK